MDFNLKDGLVLKDEQGGTETKHTHVTFKPLSAADLFAAQDEAEVTKFTPMGIELMTSTVKLSRELIRRSIKSIGDIPGIISIEMLGRLTAADFNTLVDKYNEFERANDVRSAKTLEQAEKLGKQ